MPWFFNLLFVMEIGRSVITLLPPLPSCSLKAALGQEVAVYLVLIGGRRSFLGKVVPAMQLVMPVAEIGILGNSYDRISGCSFRSWIFKPMLARLNLKLLAVATEVHVKRSKRRNWKIAFALNTGSSDATGDLNPIEDSSAFGGTRLVSIVRAASRQLLQKFNASRRNFPMKIFLLLLGFYTANALATILGQAGDWDVLVAGVVVAAIEGIGMLMYRKPLQLPVGRLQSFVVMVNYWKAGVCLGLFVDAFKLGS